MEREGCRQIREAGSQVRLPRRLRPGHLYALRQADRTGLTLGAQPQPLRPRAYVMHPAGLAGVVKLLQMIRIARVEPVLREASGDLGGVLEPRRALRQVRMLCQQVWQRAYRWR